MRMRTLSTRIGAARAIGSLDKVRIRYALPLSELGAQFSAFHVENPNATLDVIAIVDPLSTAAQALSPLSIPSKNAL